MEETAPPKLKQAAILQVVSGFINIFLIAFLSFCSIGTVMGLCTVFLGGIGGICGWWGCFLIPIGIAEVVVGIMGIVNPKTGGRFMKFVAYLEMASIIFGGIPSAIVGFLVNQWLSDPEIVAYLDVEGVE